MSSIALTNASGGERIQETVEIEIPQVYIDVQTANLVINPITTTTLALCAQLTDKSINLRPSYNRSYKWSMKKFRSYITHVWEHGAMLQSLTLYQLPADNEYECECIDGQHRMAALKHFYESSPIDEVHSTDNMVYITARGRRGTESVDVAVFYAKTVHTEKWREQNTRFATVKYLSDMPRQQRMFNRIAVQLQTITSQLSISERKRIFIDLQQGVKVTGDDLVRNLAIPLVEKIDAEVRTLYKETVIPQLMTKPSQYATHWLLRLYHLSCNQNDTAENHANLIFKDMDDKSLNQCLMAEKTLDAKEFVYDPVGYERFKRDVTRLSNFCKECAKLPTQPKLPPITMHAVYTYFSQMDDEKYANKLPMIVSWMERGQSDYIDNVQSRIRKELPEIKRNINKIWERTTKDETFEQKKEIYCVSVEILRAYTECRVMEPVQPKQKKARTKLTKNIKNEVWKRYYGAANNIVKCHVCGIKELDRNDTSCYHHAHIVPHSQGGNETVDNLIPICSSCNGAMHEENLRDFQKKHYHDVYAKWLQKQTK